MRLNERAKFPWPVLSASSMDYPDNRFGVDITITENLDAARLSARYTVTLDENNILTGLGNDQISLGLYVTCLDTYYCELLTIDLDGGLIDFRPGILYGAVTFLPIAWAKQKIAGWNSETLNDEFGNGQLGFEKGSILAIGTQSDIQAGREKLAPMESIFELVSDSDVPEGETRLSLDTDKIQIHASENTYKTLNEYRNVAGGRNILLNSVYLPAVMEVILSIGRDGSAYETRRWYEPFIAKCSHLGVSAGDDEIWESAQKLLKQPLLQLEKMKDGFLT